MKRRTMIILGVIATLFVGGAVSVYSVGPYRAAGYAASVVGPNPAFAASRHGWGHHGRGRGFAKICSEQRDERLENGIEFANAFLRLEANQTASWTKLTEALRVGSARVGEACETIKARGEPVKAPEKLAALETAVGAVLEIVREVRPAFDSFYQTLDDKQKTALDGVMNRHRR